MRHVHFVQKALTVPVEHWLLCGLVADLTDWEIDQAIQPGTLVKLGEEDNSAFRDLRYRVMSRRGEIILLLLPTSENPLRLNYDTLRDQLNMRPA